MTTNSSAPLARIRDLHDLLGVIPHLLGFHPDESLVIIVLDGAQVQVTARVDLTDVATGGQVEMLMDRLLLRWPSATVWLVGYSASINFDPFSGDQATLPMLVWDQLGKRSGTASTALTEGRAWGAALALVIADLCTTAMCVVVTQRFLRTMKQTDRSLAVDE